MKSISVLHEWVFWTHLRRNETLKCLRSGVWGLGSGVWGLGFGVWGLGFGVWGLGFGVWGLGSGLNLKT
jgi:hypothetical protein